MNNIYTVQETALYGCTPLAMQIYKIKHSVVFSLLFRYHIDMLFITWMYCHRPMVFPSFSLFWWAIPTDLFVVCTAQLGQWQPPVRRVRGAGQLPWPSPLSQLMKAPPFQTQHGIPGLDWLSFFCSKTWSQVLSWVLLMGSIIRNRAGCSEFISCSTAICWWAG